MKTSAILDKIDESQLFVPAFQREYVWKRDDAKELLDSLIKEYPTGTMLTWETNKPPELKGGHKYNEKQGAVRILLDGQQRITTLYMLIRGTIPPYYTVAEITNDTRGLHVNVETLELEYYAKLKMQKDPRWRNITDIFQGNVRAKDIVRQLEEQGRIVSRELDDQIDDNMQAVKNILDRDFPEQTIPIKATIREAINIFYKVNASGVALTDAELALAQISGYWPQAREIFKKKLNELANAGFVFKLDFVVFVLLGCLHHMGSDMRKLHGEENNEKIRQVWKTLETRTLDYVAGILRSHAFVDHTDEINSIYALVPMIVYCFDRECRLTDVEISKMVKWFYYSQVRSRYVSQLPQKLDRDLRLIAESKIPFDELLAVIAEERRLEITAEEFEGRSISHPLFGLMRWYFKRKGAICFSTGLAIRQTMGKDYQLENDHIFAYSKLKKNGYGKGNRFKYALAQELTNRAILTKVANRTKSAMDADVYLKSVRARFPNALVLQCVPTDPELWQIENYESFLRARRKTLASELNAFLEGITATSEATSAASLEDLVADGETDELEFKSSLRWDHEQGGVNKKLEDVVIKSVAAFANGQGGTLLIGVNDEGTPLGLEHDYMALGDIDRDKFELHLRNVLNRSFGETFVTSKLKILFPHILGAEICQIDIAQALKPIVLRVADKSGVQSEKFYVRSGNSSIEMPLSEMHEYAAERFT